MIDRLAQTAKGLIGNMVNSEGSTAQAAAPSTSPAQRPTPSKTFASTEEAEEAFMNRGRGISNRFDTAEPDMDLDLDLEMPTRNNRLVY
jgi:hypothetical protein